MRNPLFVLSALCSVIVMTGCATPQTERNAGTYAATAELTSRAHESTRRAVMEAERLRVMAQDVPAPWIAGAAMPISREARMPQSLRTSVPVTAFFASEPVDLATALRQISTASSLNLVAKPDALLSPGLFASRLAAAPNAATAPALVSVRASGVPLWKLLDDLAAQTQTSWRPTPTGAEFYRVVTRSYEIAAIAQKAAVASTLGRTSSAEKAFASDSKTTYSMADASQLDGLRASVEALLSVSGRLTLTPETQHLTVTDTEAVQAQVEALVREQNKQFSRRVRMLVEAIEVVSKGGSDFGIDWTTVLNTANNALTMRSPGGLSSAQAGSLGVQQMSGPLAGSGVVVQALNEVGTVVSRRVFPFITTSGRPITQALRTTFNYVDQVQVTAVASSTQQAAQAPTVTQKDETVGTFLTIVPTAKKDGSIILTVAFDVTSAEPLRPYTVGSGASAVTVQQKTINGSGVVQEVTMRSGRTEIVGGLEMVNTQNTSRRLGEGLPMVFGGSDNATSARSVTVLLVTAVAEDGV